MQRRVKAPGFRFIAWWIWRPSAAHIHKQLILVLFCACFLDENDGAECNERRRALQNRNAQRCFVYHGPSLVFLPFGVEVCESIKKRFVCFQSSFQNDTHSPRNNEISFKTNKQTKIERVIIGSSSLAPQYPHSTHTIVFPSQTLQTSLMTTSDGAFLEKSSDFRFRFHPSEYK